MIALNTNESADAVPLALRREVWSAYWKEGALHSLQGSFTGGYGGSIRAFWTDVFASLRHDDRVLDVGTGNGPLPAIVCELRGDAGVPRFDAIDLATIAPRWLDSAPAACRGNIRFHGGVAAEDLPFETGAFTLAVSQYGLEYSRLDQSVPELARVLRPNGRVALVMHHDHSRLAEVAREESRLIDSLLSPDGLMLSVSNVLPYLAKAAMGMQAELGADPQASLARSRYNAAMHALEELAKRSTYPDILLETRDFVAQQIDGLLQSRLDFEAALAALDSHVRALQASRFRSIELCGHALTEAGMAELVRQLLAHGFEGIEPRLIREGALLMGWTVHAVRSDATTR
jgi:SAM-dependent methyltransferase